MCYKNLPSVEGLACGIQITKIKAKSPFLLMQAGSGSSSHRINLSIQKKKIGEECKNDPEIELD